MDERQYVGIDVHQGKCVWCLVDPTGAVVREGTVRTDLAGLDLMTREWRRLGAGELRVGLEASTAGKAVARHLRGGGWDVWMAHPRALKAITTSETKTDRNDARALAHLVRLDYFPRAYLPSEEVERLRDLVRMREGQVEKFRRTKQQLRALLVGHHLNHEAAKYDDLFGVQALHWLKGVELAEPIEQQRMALLLEEGALYQRQVEVLTDELAKVAVDQDSVRILQSVPGIDYVLALTILAEVGDVKRFPNRKKFAAYCGLVPKNRDSGEKVGVHAKLRHGSPRLKWAFSVAIQALLKTKRGRFVVQFRRLEKRLGRPKALMAVAHRLAFTVYGIWKTGRLYEEGSASLYERKRAQLTQRAAKHTALPSRGELLDKLIQRTAMRGRPT
ncbi:MAG: IS110 family transposase [Acidimicrobiales bacterium]